MRAIGYVRVSTDEQARDGVSLEVQQAKIKGYCDLYGLNLTDTITDAGESSKTLNRPGIKYVLEHLDVQAAECVVIAKLDRLTRSVSDWQYLIDRYFCEKAGKRLCSVNDSIDTHSASGRLVLNILMSVAQWEREAISERTREALGHKIKNGERCGRVRYGYTLAADEKTLVEDREEFLILVEMRILRGNGWNYREIANHLNRNCKPCRTGKLWSHSTVRCILNRSA